MSMIKPSILDESPPVYHGSMAGGWAYPSSKNQGAGSVFAPVKVVAVSNT
jgi:hypothetical protein